jgi:uncharacterized protein YegL
VLLAACWTSRSAPPSNVVAAPKTPVCPVMRDGLCRSHAFIVVVQMSPTMTGERLAKVVDAIGAAATTLDRTADRFGVIAFERTARVVVELGAPVKLGALTSTGGKPDVDAALRLAAAQMKTLVAATKEVFVVADSGGTAASVDLVGSMRRDGIIVSALGIAGADRKALYTLSEPGEGRLYLVEDLDALSHVFMKEAKEAQKAGLLEDSLDP